jgi:4'-phosphopantetheinyl transferase
MSPSPFQRLAVHAWPQVLAGTPVPLLVPLLVPVNGLIVIQIATDDGPGGWQTSSQASNQASNQTCNRAGNSDRVRVRVRIREAVLQVLAAALALSPDRIVLTSTPGQAPCLVLNGERAAGLSISHETGLSLAAINLHGPIGVDLMRVPEQDQCEDLISVARDYLGPAQAVTLAGVAPGLRALAFATAWAAHEACLKCRALGLSEWQPPSMPLPAPLRITALDLPELFIGVIATPA